jgi:hypothetical protein
MSTQNADNKNKMTRASAGNDKINIYFNAKVLAALKRLALAKGTTYSELIRQASLEFVLREGPKMMDEAKAVKEMAK